MMNTIVFLGPPASGKGTQSKILSKKYDYIHIAAGDLLRDRALIDDEFGNMIKNIIDNGNLVEDYVVLKVIEEKLSKYPKDKKFIFDGYPRKISQGDKLEELLNKLGRTVELAINLNIDNEAILNRIVNRLMCRCGESYHSIYKKPAKEGICDICGEKLYKRKDDNKESFKVRLKKYNDITAKLKGYYESKGILKNVNALQSIEKVNQDVEKLLKENL